ncbi:MAG: tetratricopeptide repeat protein [Pseudomonadota bacterium]
MRIRRIFGVLLAVLLAVSTPVRAQTEGEISALISNVSRLRQTGKYGEAIGPAKKLLEIAEQLLGPDHPNVGTMLNNLAELYRLQGRYAEAEPLYKRTITIFEKALGRAAK